jgi:hypothetical protein
MTAILILVGVIFPDRLLGDRRILAPKMTGVLDLDLAVLDQQIHRVLRPALEEDDVVA